MRSVVVSFIVFALAGCAASSGRSAPPAASAQAPAENPVAPDPAPAGWVAFTSQRHGFVMAHPANWVRLLEGREPPDPRGGMLYEIAPRPIEPGKPPPPHVRVLQYNFGRTIDDSQLDRTVQFLMARRHAATDPPIDIRSLGGKPARTMHHLKTLSNGEIIEFVGVCAFWETYFYEVSYSARRGEFMTYWPQVQQIIRSFRFVRSQ